jgi:hypothetical protein
VKACVKKGILHQSHLDYISLLATNALTTNLITNQSLTLLQEYRSYVLGNYQFAFGYALILWLPVWLLSIVLREGRHLSLAIEISSVLGALVIIGFYLFAQDPAAYWQAILSIMIEPMMQASDVPIEQVKQTITMLAKYMTGILATGSVTGLLLGLLLGFMFFRKFNQVSLRPIIATGTTKCGTTNISI